MFTRFVRVVAWFAPAAFICAGAFGGQAASGLALDPAVGLRAYSALVEQEFDCARNGLRIIAATENATSGQWDRIKRPLAAFAAGMPVNAAVWFLRPDGSYYSVEKGFTDQNLKDRAYFPGLMAGKDVMGDLVVSKSTGKRTAIVAVPIESGGKVTGALGVSIAMEKVAALIDERIGFPKDVMFYALDSHGEIALHRQSNLIFEFAGKLGSPSLTEAVKDMLSKPKGTVHYEFQGAARTAIFERAGTTGWVYALRW